VDVEAAPVVGGLSQAVRVSSAGSAPHTRARVCVAHGRVGGAALAAPKKKVQGGGGALSGSGHDGFARGGRTPAQVFRRLGAKNY